MSSVVSIFLLLAAILLQLTIIPLFSIYGIIPDIILIFVIAVAIQRGRFWGVLAAFAAGVLFDALGTGLLGSSSLTYSIAAFVAGFLGEEQLEKRFGVIVGFLFLAVYAHDMLYHAIMMLGTSAGFGNILVAEALPHTVYTLVFLVMVQLFAPSVLWGRLRRRN